MVDPVDFGGDGSALPLPFRLGTPRPSYGRSLSLAPLSSLPGVRRCCSIMNFSLTIRIIVLLTVNIIVCGAYWRRCGPRNRACL